MVYGKQIPHFIDGFDQQHPRQIWAIRLQNRPEIGGRNEYTSGQEVFAEGSEYGNQSFSNNDPQE